MRLTKEQLQAFISQQIKDGIGFIDSDIALRRETAINYISLYMPDLPVQNVGRSKVMDSTVSSNIGMMMPSLMRIMTGGPIIGEYVAQSGNDEKAAKIATDYVNTVVLRQDNEGERVIYEWGYDGLTQIVGMVKIYWEEDYNETKEVFEGLSDDQLAQLVQSLEGSTEHSIVAYDGVEIEQEVIDPMTGQPVKVMTKTHKVEVKRTVNESKCRIVGIPPDEFIISRSARSLEEAILKTHRTYQFVGDLIEEGYDRAIVESLPTDTNVGNVSGQQRWNTWDNWQVFNSEDDPNMRRVAIHQGIIKCDYDGKGIKDWYFVAGGDANLTQILEIEEYDYQVVFADFCPQPLPHTFFGRCPADELIPIQRIKTATLRQMQDNLNLANTPQQIVVPTLLADQNAMSSLINKVPGGLIQAKSLDAVRDIATPFFAQHSLPMLAYWDGEAENRTGVSRSSMGLSADALSGQSATASQIAYNASQGKLEMIARVWASGGMRKLFRGIINVLRKYQDFPRQAKLNGELIPVNPSEWPMLANWDVSINTGLGTGSREKDMAMLQMLAAKQEQILTTGGPNNGVVTVGQYANTIRKLIEAAGIKNTDQFVQDVPPGFMGPDPTPPQPSPDAVVNAKALTDMEQIKGQVAIQKQQMELAANAQKAEADMASQERIKLAELQSKETIALADIESKERIAAGDLTIKTTANEIQAARTALEADAKQQHIDSGHMDREDTKSAREDDKNGALAAAIAGMAETIKGMNKPKRVVRDAKGKAVGIEMAD